MSGLSKFEISNANSGGDEFYEILINDMSLRERIIRHEKIQCDDVSVLGLVEGAYERLALMDAPDMPDGRVSLMVCRICGDLGCGAVSVKIAENDGVITWSELGISNNLGLDGDGPWLFEKVTSFSFSKEEYIHALFTSRSQARA